MSIRARLTILSFLQFAIWGAYLTSMGTWLAGVGLGANIGLFYAVQGFVSLFMPAVVGIVADRWVPAQRLLGVCQLLAAAFTAAAGAYALGLFGGGAGAVLGEAGAAVSAGSAGGFVPEFGPLFTLYTLGVAFYMPTIALSNSVAYSVFEQSGLDPVKAFPPIRVFGTVGFICAMLATNFVRFGAGGGALGDVAGTLEGALNGVAGAGVSMQNLPHQFVFSGILALIMGVYAFTLPSVPSNADGRVMSLRQAFGLDAFRLFRDRNMAVFFLFSMLLGVSLQITNAFANPFIDTFRSLPQFAGSWGANNANALISLSQISETLCILLIPFCLRRFGIKTVMLMAMVAWVLRFGLFGAGDPGAGVWMFVASMIVYGIAFDFFNISGSLYVNQQVSAGLRSSGQGLFVMMTNGLGATIGTLSAQAVVDRFVFSRGSALDQIAGWSTAWYIFAGFALLVAVLFAAIFRSPARVKA